MRRLHLGLFGALTPALLLSVALVGCGGATAPSPSAGGSTPGTETTGTKPKAEMQAIEPGKGVLKGKVTVKGARPDALIAQAEAALKTAIDTKPESKDFCLTGTGIETEQQHYRIDKDGNVENVFVWIQPADKNSYFKIDPAVLEKYKKGDVTINQPHCAFLPHVALLFPAYRDPKDGKKLIRTGQKVFVASSAKTTHNTKWGDGGKNPGDNLTLPEGAAPTELKAIEPSPEPITLDCNIHPWMNGYLWALDHPYAAITKADGTYQIDGVPTTGKVRIVVWHEKKGFLTGRQGEDIDLKDETTKDFQIDLTK